MVDADNLSYLKSFNLKSENDEEYVILCPVTHGLGHDSHGDDSQGTSSVRPPRAVKAQTRKREEF